MKTIFSRFHFLILLFILLIAFFLRFYKLSEIPNGLYQDETAIGYNAYSILTTSKDEYGKVLPVYFKSFGDYKLPVYIYSTVVSEKLFGVNAFAVRFPSAFFGTVAVLVLFLFAKKITGNIPLSLLSSLLLAITPWHLQFSRAGFEVNVALTFALTGSYLLILGKDKTKAQIFCLVTSIIFFGLSLYSYNVTRLLSPLIFLLIVFFYRKNFKQLPISTILIALITAAIVLFPFMTSILSKAGASSASGALITSHDIQAKTLEFRSYFIEHELLSKVFFNRWVMMIWVYLENLGSILSGNFFFVNGSPHGNQGIGTIGTFYLFELPFFLFGLLSILKTKAENLKIFIGWGVITFFVLALSKEVPHATRGYFLIIPVTIIAATGIIYGINLLMRIQIKLRYIVFTIIGVIVLYNIAYYFASYYVRFPIFYAKEWRQQDSQLVHYLMENGQKYDKIIIDSKTGFIYTSYLFYSKFNPEQFYTNSKRLPDDTEGFSTVQSFGKIVFKNVDWETDYKRPRTLIVTTPDNKPKETPQLKAFYFPTRPVVVSLKEQNFEFPVTDIPYVLVEGKE